MSAGTLRPFDASGAFGPVAGDIGELRNVAVRGAGAMVFSSGFALVFQMVATVVLARLLSPSDFGVVAMTTTFSLLLLNFGLNGFTEVVLHWNPAHTFGLDAAQDIDAGVESVDEEAA